MAAQEHPAGRIIFLNGTSSSGKSTLAVELLRTLDELYFHLAVDGFNAMGARRADLMEGERLDLALRRMRRGFHRSIAAMAAGGNNVVVDHVLSEPWRLADCLEVLAGYEVLFVGVHCPLPELRRRERDRGDRGLGIAERQYGVVHAHGHYDLEVDTFAEGTEECARAIRAHLAARPAGPTAFDRLRSAAAAS
ncbi:chloramphenicol phosphotransferase [Kitasatospora sp. MMS16-BH015]|uniref:chloramphenicol phosphotransferase CPT family protein n=1 Tax=Kitasatospora sp. MMS16-BH015 TaxID=2018025 RepID=UPI000CA123B3|nr:AAA family ATPase [Kitasatospora sp. MMS16-BH015]AUG76059.1 chloramphenicol phosphotransferase [Kitasatospora sp. MMS16-BH015]